MSNHFGIYGSRKRRFARKAVLGLSIVLTSILGFAQSATPDHYGHKRITFRLSITAPVVVSECGNGKLEILMPDLVRDPILILDEPSGQIQIPIDNNQYNHFPPGLGYDLGQTDLDNDKFPNGRFELRLWDDRSRRPQYQFEVRGVPIDFHPQTSVSNGKGDTQNRQECPIGQVSQGPPQIGQPSLYLSMIVPMPDEIYGMREAKAQVNHGKGFGDLQYYATRMDFVYQSIDLGDIGLYYIDKDGGEKNQWCDPKSLFHPVEILDANQKVIAREVVVEFLAYRKKDNEATGVNSTAAPHTQSKVPMTTMHAHAHYANQNMGALINDPRGIAYDGDKTGVDEERKQSHGACYVLSYVSCIDGNDLCNKLGQSSSAKPPK